MKEERGGKRGAAERREQTGSEAEEEAAEAEGRDREKRFDPAVGFRGRVRSGTAETEEDCIALKILVRSHGRNEGRLGREKLDGNVRK